jgi:glyoxylase-like metal-dependent hydrolase (beta-lactamase superfamily II)
MQQILPGLFTFSGLLVGRIYLTEDADGGFTLIDAGITRSADRVLRQLGQSQHAPGKVRRIIITHAHPDHVGGLPRLKQATGAEVIASFVERPFVEGKVPVQLPARESLPLFWRMTYQPPRTLPGAPVDRDVADGDLIAETFGGVQVVFTPGHTPGQISLWQPERRVLITGDTIANLPPWGLRLPFVPFTADMTEARRSVQRIAPLQPETILFGHGQPLLHDAARQLQAFARRVARAQPVSERTLS